MSFNPKFAWLKTLAECAKAINLPHEDYPFRVAATEEMISLYQGKQEITEWDNKTIHSGVMWGKDFRGRYRDLEVTVNGYIPPKFHLVPDLIAQLFPVRRFNSTEEAIKWYINFENIHPYQDGNGRVGGIIVAALTYSPDMGYLSPIEY